MVMNLPMQSVPSLPSRPGREVLRLRRPMTESILTPHTVFAGRYRVLGQIGSGGFGAVYEAVHVVTERRVAIKALWPHFAKDPAARARFLRESKLATQVGGEYIVSVLDAGVDETTDIPFLVMELLEGESLNARAQRKGVFTPEETLVYLSQVAVALERTHRRGVVHRDLKPANLFLTLRHDGSPLVKILDFGIAKLVASSGVEASNTLGTPLYMAPEQFTQAAVTPAVDVYALALVAFRFLVGAHYFKLEQQQCETVYLLAATLAEGPKEAATLRARRYGVALPAAFDAWFARAAHPSASERTSAPTAAILELCDVLGVAPRPPLVAAPATRRTGAISFMVNSTEEVPPLHAGRQTSTQTGGAAANGRVTASLGPVGGESAEAVVVRTAPKPDAKPLRAPRNLAGTLLSASGGAGGTEPASLTHPAPQARASQPDVAPVPSLPSTFIATVPGYPVATLPRAEERPRTALKRIGLVLGLMGAVVATALAFGLSRVVTRSSYLRSSSASEVEGIDPLPKPVESSLVARAVSAASPADSLPSSDARAAGPAPTESAKPRPEPPSERVPRGEKSSASAKAASSATSPRSSAPESLWNRE